MERRSLTTVVHRQWQWFATGLLASAVALGGCTSPPSAPTIPSESSQAADYPQLSDWRPSTRVIHDEISDDEASQLRDEWLTSTAASLGLEPPTADLVRWTTPSETGAAVEQCMESVGVPVELGPDGNVSFESHGDSDARIFRQQLLECYAAYTPQPEFLMGRTPDQHRLVYEYNRDFLAPCLQAHGISFPMESPSEQAYLDAVTGVDDAAEIWEPGSIGQWDQDSQKRATTDDDWAQEVFDRCPAIPPDEYLFGQ